MEDVRKVFRPEFINRLDEIVVFDRLNREELRQIVDIQLKQLESRLSRRELKLEVTPAGLDVLAEAGWDPQYGARPLKRAIRKYIEDPIAKALLGGHFPPGTTILADRDATGELSFKAKALN
jgi:ATP-dependent Clp protease ATP-binding subunit ClpA